MSLYLDNACCHTGHGHRLDGFLILHAAKGITVHPKGDGVDGSHARQRRAHATKQSFGLKVVNVLFNIVQLLIKDNLYIGAKNLTNKQSKQSDERTKKQAENILTVIQTNIQAEKEENLQYDTKINSLLYLDDI